jgi:hypothetical protein
VIDAPELDALEQYLREAMMLRAWVGIEGQGGGHPNKWRLELDGGVYVVAKLGDDDNTARMVRAEAAAWALARVLGWEDLVAATVVRDVDLPDVGRIPASLQVIWPAFEWLTSLESFERDDVVRAAAFDVLIRMSDRGNNNWLGAGPRGEPKALKLIDHGHAFVGEGSTGSSFVEHVKVGAPLADDQVMALAGATRDRIAEALEALVGPPVVDDLAARAQAIAQARALILPEQAGV